MRRGSDRLGRGERSQRLRRIAAVLILCLLPATADAQKSRQELQDYLDAIYLSLLVDPSSRGLNRRLMEVALELKDYETAIGAVERLIAFDPDDLRLQLLAATFYIEIKSYAAARGYLEEILAKPAVSADLLKEAKELIDKIDAATRPSPWSLFAQVGIRYQTNANVSPSATGPEEIVPVEEPMDDWNTFGLGTLAYSYRMGNTYIESSFSAYYADQFQINRLDLGFAEARGGPRIVTDGGMLSIKPYGLVQGVLLGDDPYQRTYGGGVLGRMTFARDWWFEPQFEFKDRRFYDSDDYMTASEQTGDLYTYAINANGRLGNHLSWQSRLAFFQNYAEVDYQSYDYYSAGLVVRINFDVFEWQNWVLSPFASASLTDYKGIDLPEIQKGVDTIREDFQWNAGATLEIPLTEMTGLNVQVRYTDNASNLDRFRFKNLQVMSGPTLKF